jgi:glucosamine-6-phosphate deaminase
MNMKVFSTADELAMESANFIRAAIEQKPDLLCCFAAGRTQIPTYSILADWVKRGALDMSRVRFLGLDEIVGAARAKREGFYHFLDVNLFGSAGIGDGQITFIDGLARDMVRECKRIDAFLDDNGPIDLLLLGVGGNGHIGYNEPGADPDARTHIVALEQSSIGVGQSYFDHNFAYALGATLGLRDLLSARRIVVQATGASKKAALDCLRAGKMTRDVPVTLLLSCEQNVQFFADKAAAGA